MDETIASQLLARFSERWKALCQQARAALQPVNEELAAMRVAYGEEIIAAAMKDEPLPALDGVTAAAPAEGKAEKPQRRKRAKKRAKKSRNRIVGLKTSNVLTFQQAKEAVLDILKPMDPKTKFTVGDVARALKEKGKRFNMGHLSLVLSKYLTGIQVVGKGERNGAGGAKPNVYEKTGAVKIEKFTKAVK